VRRAGLGFYGRGAQNGSFLYISQTGTARGQIRVDNVQMYSPNIGITLTESANGVGDYWIERVLIGGTFWSVLLLALTRRRPAATFPPVSSSSLRRVVGSTRGITSSR
jgi:hypothetical protein